MSRRIERGKDERGRYIMTTIEDADECRWLYNGICCNDDCELCIDDVREGDCDICLHRQAETQDDIARLKDGEKKYD